MKKFFSAVISALVLASVTLFGCSNEIDNKSNLVQQALLLSQKSNSYGSLTINGDSSRALYAGDLTSATVTVASYGNSDVVKENVQISGGTGGASIDKIPVGKNRVVKVESNLSGAVLYAVTDISAGYNSCIVNWESSKIARVYWELLKVQNVDITNIAESAFSSAVPAGTHACLIDAAAIAKDYKNDSLKSASNYKLEAGKVTVKAYKYNGLSVQVTDPVSETGVLSSTSGGETTIENVAPGNWKLYVLEGDTVKEKKSVAVESGKTVSVTVGSQEFDGIQIQVAKSLGYSFIHYWSCSDNSKYPNTAWPGTAMLDDWCDDDYIYNFEGCSSVQLLIVNASKKKLCEKDIKITAKGAYRITSGGASASTYISDVPPEPVAPTVRISPSDGSSIALNGSVSVQFDNGNDTITSAKVTVNGTEYNMGTTAGTWSKSLSELGITSEGATVTVNASVTNSAGTGTASATLTTKEASKLVTNPNELRIYQVMVASFQDGDSSIGYTKMWGPDNALKGGDLQGIINALDYIKGLGCNALWMTPIFQSNGSDEKLNATGYFASDYFNVDCHFGTNEKFAELVEACHNKGIAVILDGVFGHNGGSVKPSPNRNGILNPGISPDTNNPVNYASNENSLKYYSDVARYWITEYKIDGWRFDQCYQVGLGDKSSSDNTGAGGHNYWYDIRKVIEEASASNGTKGTDWGTLGYMVGEHWNGDQTRIQAGSVASGSAAGYGLNSCFDFPAYYKIVQGFACEYGYSSKTTNNISTGLSYLYQTYSDKGYSCVDDDGTSDTYYPNFMLTNHDLYRIGDVIKGKWGCGYDSDEYIGRNKVLLAAQCAYSGPITIYYGDEIGDHSVDLSGWGGDNVARNSGKITGFNSREQTIYNWTQKCLAARAEHEALWNGTNEQITGNSDFYVAKKVGGGETIYIAFNYNKSSSKSFSINSASGTDLISGESFNGTVTVPALSARYILVK